MTDQPPPHVRASSRSGELMAVRLDAAQPSIPPMDSGRRGTGADIDPERLYRAWDTMADVLRDLIAVVSRSEEEAELIRRDNARTRLVALVALVLTAALVLVSGVFGWVAVSSTRAKTGPAILAPRLPR